MQSSLDNRNHQQYFPFFVLRLNATLAQNNPRQIFRCLLVALKRMKRQHTTFLIFAFVIAITVSFLPSIFLPKRWNDITPGISRQAVHEVLGVPDANYSVKSFDGWHNPFTFGASVLIVRYDESAKVVVAAEIKTYWGFHYKEWAQDYKNYLK
jgi:hypothetical protein